MSDIAPKAIAATPPGVAPTTSITAAAAPPATASAAEIPAAIANLSVGTFVTGTVLERGPRGLAVLRTDKGTIKLYTPVPLKQGSNVTLQIQSVGAQVQLSILSVDGQPLAHPAKGPGAPARPDAAARTAAGSDIPARSPPPHGASAAPTGAAVAAGGHGAPLGATQADRAAADRAPPASHPPAQTTTAGFVARPLIASTSAASLQALSTPPTPAPGPSGTTPAQTPATTPTSVAAGAPPEASHTISIGARFVAAFTGTPSSDAPMPPKAAAGVPPVPANPSPAASLAGAVPASAPAPAVAPPPPASDHVVLRLLGMALPAQGNPTGKMPGVSADRATKPPSAAGVQPAAGISVPDDAFTAVGTIIADDRAPNRLSASSPSPVARTVIHTPFGVLTAAGAPPGPVGTQLLLEVVLRNDAPLPSPERPDMPTWLTASASGRNPDAPALRELLSAAQSLPPDVADHLLNATMPRPGPQLAAGLLFFVAALRQGSPRAWLGGPAVEALQRGGQNALVEKLTDEFTVLARMASETSANGWQTLLFPLFDGERLQQIRLHLRRSRRKDDRREDGTRFMIEAELSKFGPLQLDGLVSKPQFDLVVRTRTALPPEIRGDIIEIFGDALLATSLKGAVSFQSIADIRPGPPTSEGDAGIGLIV